MVAHVELFRALGGEWNQKGEENHAGSATEMHSAVQAMSLR